MQHAEDTGRRGQKVANWVLDHRLITILFVLVPSLILAYALPSIEVYSRFADLLPAKHTYIKNYNRMKQTFGGANVVTMSLEVVGEGDIFTVETLNKIKLVTEEVDIIQGVNHYQVASIAHPKIRRIRTTSGGLIKSEPVLPRIIPSDPEGLKRLREESFNNDIIYGTYISADGKAALILAGFDEERLDYEKIFTRLQALKAEIEASGTNKLYVAGEPMLKGWIYYHSSELTLIFGITFGVMVLLLFLHFRSLAGVLVPMLGTGMAAIWGLGLVGWLGYNLDPLILVVPILISARTASHCVQMMERYHDEIRLGATRDAAVRKSMGELIVPASIAIFTDAGGLLVLAVSSIPIIAKLGIFCSFWSMSNLLTVTILVPLMLSYLPAPKVGRDEEHKHVYARIMARWSVFLTSPKASVPIFGFAGLLIVIAVYYAKDAVVGENKPGSPILFQESEYNLAAAKIAGKFAGANQFSIYFESEEAHTMKKPEVVAVMEEFGRHMANTINYGGTRDIPNLVRSINRLYHYDDPRWSLVPSTQRDVGNTLFMYEAGAAIPGVILEYMDLEGRTANFVVFFKDATGPTVYAAIDAAKEFLDTDRNGVTRRRRHAALRGWHHRHDRRGEPGSRAIRNAANGPHHGRGHDVGDADLPFRDRSPAGVRGAGDGRFDQPRLHGFSRHRIERKHAASDGRRYRYRRGLRDLHAGPHPRGSAPPHHRRCGTGGAVDDGRGGIIHRGYRGRGYFLLDSGFFTAIQQRNGDAAVTAHGQQYDRRHLAVAAPG